MADEPARAQLHTDLDVLAREGARRMLAAALEAEVDDSLVAHAAAVVSLTVIEQVTPALRQASTTVWV